MKKSLYLIAGILIGAALTGGSAAVAAGITAERSHHRVVVDGKDILSMIVFRFNKATDGR